jgi:hypothetical protein
MRHLLSTTLATTLAMALALTSPAQAGVHILYPDGHHLYLFKSPLSEGVEQLMISSTAPSDAIPRQPAYPHDQRAVHRNEILWRVFGVNTLYPRAYNQIVDLLAKARQARAKLEASINYDLQTGIPEHEKQIRVFQDQLPTAGLSEAQRQHIQRQVDEERKAIRYAQESVVRMQAQIAQNEEKARTDEAAARAVYTAQLKAAEARLGELFDSEIHVKVPGVDDLQAYQAILGFDDEVYVEPSAQTGPLHGECEIDGISRLDNTTIVIFDRTQLFGYDRKALQRQCQDFYSGVAASRPSTHSYEFVLNPTSTRKPYALYRTATRWGRDAVKPLGFGTHTVTRYEEDAEHYPATEWNSRTDAFFSFELPALIQGADELAPPYRQ